MRTIILAVVLLGGCAGMDSRRIGGGEWGAVNINGVPVAAGSTITLRLGDGARMSGSSGCNSYSGSYAIASRERISLGPVASTRRLCEAEAMEQERRYLAILQNVWSYSLYGDGSLSLIAADGSAIRYRMNGGR